MFEVYDEDLQFWGFRPEGGPGDWERCQCDCHRPGLGRSVHVMACCLGGWKKTFQRIAREMREYQEKMVRERQIATVYRPAHGGYPG